jgi:hypothetical protein
MVILCSVCQDVYCLVWNLKVHYHVHKTPAPVHVFKILWDCKQIIVLIAYQVTPRLLTLIKSIYASVYFSDIYCIYSNNPRSFFFQNTLVKNRGVLFIWDKVGNATRQARSWFLTPVPLYIVPACDATPVAITCLSSVGIQLCYLNSF